MHGGLWEHRRGVGLEGPCQKPLEHAVAKPRMSGQLGKFKGGGHVGLGL